MIGIVSSPPSTVSVGELFEVSVFVGLSGSAPLANFPVTLSITPNELGVLKESVTDFIERLSGNPVDTGRARARTQTIVVPTVCVVGAHGS